MPAIVMRPCSTRPALTTSKIDHRSFRCSFAEPRLPAETIHVAVLFPGIQLPSIDDLLPFCRQEPKRKLMVSDFFEACCISSEICASVAIRSLPMFSS